MLVSVALPLPFFQPLTYAVPPELSERVNVGSRVVVPVRGRREMGFVVGDGAVLREGLKAKTILAAPDTAPVLEPSLLAVCRWIADYYIAPLGMVLRTILAPSAVEGMSAERTGQYSYQMAQQVGGGSPGPKVRLTEQDKEELSDAGYGPRKAATVQVRL